MTRPRIALVLRALDGGGMQRCMLELGQVFTERGCEVILLVGDASGPMRAKILEGVELRPLAEQSPLTARLTALSHLGWQSRPLLGVSTPRMLRHLDALAGQLRLLRPQAVLAMGTQSNLAALWARALAGVDARVVLCECATLSVAASRSARRFRRSYPALVGRHYPAADGIVAVSEAVAGDLVATAHLPRAAITAIPNWVTTEILSAPLQAPDHPWLSGDACPVVLAVGRLHWQKDFATLIRAFALLCRHRPAHLVFLGEGAERARLEELAGALGVASKVHFAGFVSNPFAWMSRASVLAVASLSEGFGNVIVEALACGLPVVSTDCPGGPREILAGGRFGRLVPVGEAESLASALEQTIFDPPKKVALKRRAADFSLSTASERYLDLLLEGKMHVARRDRRRHATIRRRDPQRRPAALRTAERSADRVLHLRPDGRRRSAARPDAGQRLCGAWLRCRRGGGTGAGPAERGALTTCAAGGIGC
jgi:glycosyltransferase involved in cell wall biosynthesis